MTMTPQEWLGGALNLFTGVASFITLSRGSVLGAHVDHQDSIGFYTTAAHHDSIGFYTTAALWLFLAGVTFSLQPRIFLGTHVCAPWA